MNRYRSKHDNKMRWLTTTTTIKTSLLLVLLSTTLLLSLIPLATAQESNQDVNLWVDASTGNDDNTGDEPNQAVRSLGRALELVADVTRPLAGFLYVNLAGTFVGERLRPRQRHYAGTNSAHRLVFRSTDSDTPARILGGVPLNFVKVSELDPGSPGYKLAAKLGGANGTLMDELYAAAPPAELLDTLAAEPSLSAFRWPDKDCRSEYYRSPPVLSVMGKHVMERAREPNLPPFQRGFPPNDMGEVRQKWLRTSRRSTDSGRVYFEDEDQASIALASEQSWNSGAVTVHMFPQKEWYDARVRVSGSRALNKNYFATTTKQTGPGNAEMKDDYIIEAGSRYYFEGALEYLDKPCEYFTSLGETDDENDDESSLGWTLLYPAGMMDDPTKLQAVLSLYDEPLVHFNDDYIPMAFISFWNLLFEGSRRHLVKIEETNCVEFKECTFVNAGHDAVSARGHAIFFNNNKFEGIGGRAISMTDHRNHYSDDTPKWMLMESGTAIFNNIISNYGLTCRHYSDALVLRGYGALISNNHIHSSSCPAISVEGGGYKILHNVFSHVADGAYDSGVLHWGVGSPMERGVQVAYNLFFRNGYSMEPCHAKSNCVVTDILIDNASGALRIHGNVFVKDKVDQPNSEDYPALNWMAICINGGADVEVYENVFLGPRDGNNALHMYAASFFQQTSAGTLFSTSTECGHTGICEDDLFYRSMTRAAYDAGPWAEAFPELAAYKLPNEQPPQLAGEDWYCADTRSCPLASWNNTVVCNAGLGQERDYGHRAIWPTDDYSMLFAQAEAGKNVPRRDEALTEFGNKRNVELGSDMTEATIDRVEMDGLESVRNMVGMLVEYAEASAPLCKRGTRKAATRHDLCGPWNNPCVKKWSGPGGMASCDPCHYGKDDQEEGKVRCSKANMPSYDKCACTDMDEQDEEEIHREHVKKFLKQRGHHSRNRQRARDQINT